MAGAAPNEGTTRRLPRWMVAPPVNDRRRESSCRDSNVDQINEGVVSPQRTNSKSLTTRPKRASSLQEKYSSKVSGFGIVECGRKRRKRRASELEDSSNVSTHEVVEDIKEHRRGRRKAQDSVFRKRRKSKSLVAEGDEEPDTAFASDDDVELTVEDLLSIAEEYIASNESVEQQRQPLVRSEKPMRASGNVQQDSLDAGAIHDEVLDDAKPTMHNSTGVSTSEETVVSIKRTGDPAQDMLDLFLGPLLRKPMGEEKMSQFVAEEVIAMQDQKKQSQNVVSVEAVSPLKKKSSLKDKVAMFF